MIYVIDGVDGVGKSTLAVRLARYIGGTVLHSGYNKDWNMQMYHTVLMEAALDLDSIKIPVILDRWAPSEAVYGKVFRGGESYDTQKLINQYRKLAQITWIYCRNDEAVMNHEKNRQLRTEMYFQIDDAAKEFDKYISRSSVKHKIQWHTFDYSKVTTEKFLRRVA